MNDRITVLEVEVEKTFQEIEQGGNLDERQIIKNNNFFIRLLNELAEMYRKLFFIKKFNDEPENRIGMIIVDGWRRIWPRSTEYRIVDYELDYHRYGIQAKIGNDWVDLQTYDSGYDRYGKLNAGQWVLLRKKGRWSLNDVKQLINKLLDIPEVPKVLNIL